MQARRSNTDFALNSMEMNVRLRRPPPRLATGLTVNLTRPDATVYVEVVQGDVYVYARRVQGAGGLPVGTAGRVVSLLSAGIDSPVASWRMIRRGAVLVGVHFSGRPQTNDASERLVVRDRTRCSRGRWPRPHLPRALRRPPARDLTARAA